MYESVKYTFENIKEKESSRNKDRKRCKNDGEEKRVNAKRVQENKISVKEKKSVSINLTTMKIEK